MYSMHTKYLALIFFNHVIISMNDETVNPVINKVSLQNSTKIDSFEFASIQLKPIIKSTQKPLEKETNVTKYQELEQKKLPLGVITIF